MNIFVGIMLIFAAAGFVDKAAGGRWGLSEHFDKGLETMAVMVIPVVSICSVGVEFIHRHIDVILQASGHFFFDPSMVVGAILAPDLGGYFISREVAASPELVLINGVVLATLLGQATTFQLPIFMAGISPQDRPPMFKGFIVGFILVPAGLLAAQAILRMPVILFLKQFIPILVLCLLLAVFLWKAPEATARVFSWFGQGVQWLYYLLFAVAAIGLFLPSMAYASLDSIEEAVTVVLKASIIIGGALVMSELILKVFGGQVSKIAQRLGINEVAAVSLLMTCATSLAVIPLFREMDPKGKQMVTAFSVSGSFVIGGSLAFVSSVASGFAVTLFIVSKLVCGILSAWVVHRMYRKDSGEER